MFTYISSPRPKVLVLTDTRTLNDANTDHAQGNPGPGAHAVLNNWIWGTRVWGTHGWKQVARCALFEFGQVITPAMRKEAKRELRKLLTRLRPERIVVLQSRSKSAKKVYDDNYAESKHVGTIVWDFFDPPGSIMPSKVSPGFAGTLWDTPYGTVMVIPNPQNVDYVYGAAVATWLGWARDLTPRLELSRANTASEPGELQHLLLQKLLVSARAGKVITFDLETFSTQDLITCIGLSDGEHTVSVPWESFRPHGQSYTEPGLCLAPEGDVVREIFATARVVAGHNILRFDMPYLARKGIPVGGKPFDTYLAHGITLNQFKHGLQSVVSYEFPVKPWKALHRAQAQASGLNPDTQPTAWICNPSELREYNVLDTYFNALVVPLFAERIGITL